MLVKKILGAVALFVAGIGPIDAADLAKQQLTASVAPVGPTSDTVARLHLVDQLSVLTQRVAAASCAMSAGLSVEESREILKSSSREFGTAIRALRSGNPSLFIETPETHPRLRDAVDTVWEAWGYTKSAIYGRLAGRDDDQNAERISALSDALLRMTRDLASDYYGRYTNPFELTQADAMALSIAARQAQLTQDLSREICERLAHHDASQADGEIRNTIEIFEASLLALQGGMDSVGLRPAPTPLIASKLALQSENWKSIKATYFATDKGEPLDAVQANALILALHDEYSEITEIVGHYAEHAAQRN